MRNGIPVSARLPIMRAVTVKGTALNRPSIFQMSCSSFRLCVIDREHKQYGLKKGVCADVEEC